jgi:hypothetical protein
MPQPCSICTHPDRVAIDKEIASDAPNRRIATQYGLSEAAVRRHKKDHLPDKLVKAAEAREIKEAGSLYDELMEVTKETKAILKEMRKKGHDKDNRGALAALQRLEKQIELQSRLMGAIRPDQVTVQTIIQESNMVTDIFIEALRSELDPESCKRVVAYIQRRRAAIPADTTDRGPSRGAMKLDFLQ